MCPYVDRCAPPEGGGVLSSSAMPGHFRMCTKALEDHAPAPSDIIDAQKECRRSTAGANMAEKTAETQDVPLKRHVAYEPKARSPSPMCEAHRRISRRSSQKVVDALSDMMQRAK